MAPRLPDADQIASLRLAGRGTSRFPCNELPHMPGSSTTPGPPGARAYAPVCIAFRLRNGVSTRNMNLCGAQWLAYVLLCRRFAVALTGDRRRLVVDVGRYSFIVSDLHRLLIAGLPAHRERFCTSFVRGRRTFFVLRRLVFEPPRFDVASEAASLAGEVTAAIGRMVNLVRD